MARKVLMLGLAPLALVAVAPSASANPGCPDLSNSGLSDEEITARCADSPERFFAGLFSWFDNVVYYFYPAPIDLHPH